MDYNFDKYHLPGTRIGVRVLGKEEKDLVKALKVFKRRIKNNEILDEFKERQFFEKKSVKRRRILKTARFNAYVKDKREKSGRILVRDLKRNEKLGSREKEN